MMATVSVGLFPDIEACTARWIAPVKGEVEWPDPALVRAYEALFSVYRDGYASCVCQVQQKRNLIRMEGSVCF